MLSPGSADIIFAGSPEFAIPSLKSLVASGHKIIGVLTQPDRPAGRGRTLRPGPVKTYAQQQGLQILQPDSLKAMPVQQRLREMRPDLMVIVAYGLLLPREVLDIPRAGCINVHASLLPRWRGASPIQAAILAGDHSTGISIMGMEEGLDTGPVYAKKEIPVGPGETTAQLEGRLAEAGAALLIDTLPGILDGSAAAEAQCDDDATFAGRIYKADALIDWSMPACEIDRRIRAYNPWPVAYTTLDGLHMRCWAAVPVTESVDKVDASSDTDYGKVRAVSDSGIEVQTGDGVLRITELQLAGKQKMLARDFANGYPVLAKFLGRRE